MLGSPSDSEPLFSHQMINFPHSLLYIITPQSISRPHSFTKTSQIHPHISMFTFFVHLQTSPLPRKTARTPPVDDLRKELRRLRLRGEALDGVVVEEVLDAQILHWMGLAKPAPFETTRKPKSEGPHRPSQSSSNLTLLTFLLTYLVFDLFF